MELKKSSSEENLNALSKITLKLDQKEASVSFEEALQMTGFGKFNYYLILIAGIILSASFVETLSISFVLPVSECEMHFSSAEKGLLSAVGFAGIITSSHLWGFLSDTKGRRAIIVPSLFVAFFCTLASSLSSSFWSLFVFRYLNGFFISGSSASIYAYLGEFHTAKHRARAIMVSSVIFGCGCILMPVVAFLVINQHWEFYVPLLGIVYKPWRLFLLVCGVPSLLCAIALMPAPESPKFILSLGRQKETIDILQLMRRWNGGVRNQDGQIELTTIIEEQESIELRRKREANAGGGVGAVVKSMWAQTVPLFRQPYLTTTIIASVMQFGIFINANGMYMWFPEILNRVTDFMNANPGRHMGLCDILDVTRKNMTENSTMVCLTELESATYGYSFLLELLYAIFFGVIALVINGVGKFSVLLTVNLACGICGLFAVYVTIPTLQIYLYIVLLLAGLAVPVVNAATVDLYSTSSRGMAVCLTLMMGRLGSVVGANMVATLIESHCKLTFSMAGIILIFCAFLTFFIPNIMKSAKQQQQQEELQQQQQRDALSH